MLQRAGGRLPSARRASGSARPGRRHSSTMNALPTTAPGSTPARTGEWLALVLLPLAGLAILLAEPSADVHWEHHPSHFWLVLSASVISAGLAFATGEAARHRADARL